MAQQSWLAIVLTLLIAFGLSIPVGRYLALVFMDLKTALDAVFDPVDNVVYRLVGRIAASAPMDWKRYTLHMLATNLFMAVIIYLVLVFQDHLPLNPEHLAGMEP